MVLGSEVEPSEELYVCRHDDDRQADRDGHRGGWQGQAGQFGQAGLVDVPHVARSPTVAGSALAVDYAVCRLGRDAARRSTARAGLRALISGAVDRHVSGVATVGVARFASTNETFSGQKVSLGDGVPERLHWAAHFAQPNLADLHRTAGRYADVEYSVSLAHNRERSVVIGMGYFYDLEPIDSDEVARIAGVHR